MAIDIVSFPINSMVIFHSYVSLPEGIWKYVGTDGNFFYGKLYGKKDIYNDTIYIYII